MKTNVRIAIYGDSVSTIVSVNEYEIIDTPDFSDNVITSIKYYPNELFLISNFYKENNRPKNFNNVLKSETISILDSFFRYMNEAQ